LALADDDVSRPANFGAGTAPLEQINISTGTVSYLVSDVTGVYALLSSAGIDDTGYTYSDQFLCGSTISISKTYGAGIDIALNPGKGDLATAFEFGTPNTTVNYTYGLINC
jgi:hypothetical protein